MVKKLILQVLYWMFQFLKYVVIITLVGTIMGGLLFPVFSKAFTDHSFWFLAKKGACLGFEYAGKVWAIGTSMVICTMKAREQYIRKINAKTI